MLRGIKQGIGLLIVFGTAAFAYTVSGTVKTWVSGDTLTASDLNTTVQSLKTAVESAAQTGMIQTPTNISSGTYYTPFLVGGVGASPTEQQVPALRAGTVKNVTLTPTYNPVTAACTYTLRKNAVDTNVQVVVPANSLTTVTNANTVTFAATDKLSWKATCGAQTVSMIGYITFEF